MVVLSIIVPCYNSESYIMRCLESLSMIRNPAVEFVIVNDGSFDGTLAIAESFSMKDSRFLIFSKENGGYSTAINYGIERSRGRYLMFLGSDDEVDSEGIDNILSEIDDACDIVCFSTKVICDDGREDLDPITIYKQEGMCKATLFSLSQNRPDDSRIIFTRDTSRFFSKNSIGEVRYFGKIGVSADGCFSMLVASKANDFCFLNILGYVWHKRNDSLSGRKKSANALRDEFVVWDSFFSEIKVIYADKEIPFQIFRYIWAFYDVCLQLDKISKEKKASKRHEKCVKKYMKWFLFNKYVAKKQKIKLLFPRFYRHYCSRKMSKSRSAE